MEGIGAGERVRGFVSMGQKQRRNQLDTRQLLRGQIFLRREVRRPPRRAHVQIGTRRLNKIGIPGIFWLHLVGLQRHRTMGSLG